MIANIVINPLKVDLHIHSCASHFKDGGLVSSGTKENLPILWANLKSNCVDVFSITDHDCFDYSLYLENKKKENDHTFQKVFPGIEFSVSFLEKGTNEKHPIHVIAVFDDEDEEKVKSIANLLPPGVPQYDDGDCFSESKFRALLQQIDLNVVLIAHQKNSLLSEKPRKDDANSVGADRFKEFINVGYFESYEFKSAQAGLFNGLFKAEHDADDNLRFITGSDCHQWSVYPQIQAGKSDEMVFTFLKCLPSFRGLAMALTDSSRVRKDPNFFSDLIPYLDRIEINVNGREVSVPLSRGINAIIGDNSIGKSMFLHAMTGYRSFVDSPNLLPSIKNGYQQYLNEHKIVVKTIIPSDSIYKFDSQGEIRKRFETGDAFKQPFVVSKYPEPTDSTNYRAFIDKQFQNLYDKISNRFEYDRIISSLGAVTLVSEPEKSKNLVATVIPSNDLEKVGTPNKIRKSFVLINAELEKLRLLISDENDLALLLETEKTINHLATKYSADCDSIVVRNTIRTALNRGIAAFKSKQSKAMDREESEWDTFQNYQTTLASNISQLFSITAPEGDFSFAFDEMPVTVNKRPYGNIAFVNRFKSNLATISPNYCQTVLQKVLLENKKINLSTITTDSLTGIIKDRKEDADLLGLDLLKKKISTILDDDFKAEKAIVKNDGKDDAEYSSGFNASKYFDLISDDIDDKGIYLVDQPEDDVSQPSIKTNILPDLRKMRANRQIILITHNPQFVVNLDVDNVLYFYDGNDGFDIKSGALEYFDVEKNCDILKLVSDNLEGGIESLKKRWKRYEKNSDLMQG